MLAERNGSCGLVSVPLAFLPRRGYSESALGGTLLLEVVVIYPYVESHVNLDKALPSIILTVGHVRRDFRVLDFGNFGFNEDDRSSTRVEVRDLWALPQQRRWMAP